MAGSVFWAAALVLVYTYLIYPGVLLTLAGLRRGRPVPPRTGTDVLPAASVVLVVRNERARVEQRLRNLLDQDYPAGRLEIVVASDGSTDGTDEIVQRFVTEGVRFVACPPGGKAAAINAAVDAARGDVLVFGDARQRFAHDAVRRLVAELGGDTGAVSGRLILQRSVQNAGTGSGEYWSLESRLRGAESRTGSVIGVTGAIYAARRELYPVIPPGTLVDDLFVPMSIAMRGARIGYVPEALAYDAETVTLRSEYRRKVRTLTGNYQLLRLLPGVLSPRRNRLFVRFLSHKLLRLASPLLLVLVLVSSALQTGVVYRTAFVVQLAFYALGVVGLNVTAARRRGIVRIPSMILVFSAAAAAAFWYWVRGQEHRVWRAAPLRDGDDTQPAR